MRFSITLLSLIVFNWAFSQQILAKHEFEAEGVSEVYISGKFCEVIIAQDSKLTFSGLIEGRGKPDDFEITSDLIGKTLRIEVIKKYDGAWNKLTKAQFNIGLPDGVKIKIENSSGDVSVRDISYSSFNIRTTSGDLRMIALNGPADISSTSGDIAIYGLIGDLQIESTSGNQNINQIEGAIKSRATSGDLELTKVVGNIIAETTSGDIDIKESLGFLNLQTTSGDISGYQIALTENSYFKASSGTIQIRFKDRLSNYLFNLQSTSGFLRAGDSHGERKLKTMGEGISIIGVTTSGDQYYTN